MMNMLRNTGQSQARLTNYRKGQVDPFECNVTIKKINKDGSECCVNAQGEDKAYLCIMQPINQQKNNTPLSFSAFTAAHPKTTRHERLEAISRSLAFHPNRGDLREPLMAPALSVPSLPWVPSSSRQPVLSESSFVSKAGAASYSAFAASYSPQVAPGKRQRCERVKAFYDTVAPVPPLSPTSSMGTIPPPAISATTLTPPVAEPRDPAPSAHQALHDVAEPVPLEKIAAPRVYSYGNAIAMAAKANKSLSRAERRQAMQTFLLAVTKQNLSPTRSGRSTSTECAELSPGLSRL